MRVGCRADVLSAEAPAEDSGSEHVGAGKTRSLAVLVQQAESTDEKWVWPWRCRCSKQVHWASANSWVHVTRPAAATGAGTRTGNLGEAPDTPPPSFRSAPGAS